MYRGLLVMLFFLTSGYALVQVSTNTPYSSRGIGDVGFTGNAYINGLGGAAVALTDSSQANLYNPSTYSLLAKKNPLFSFGVNHFEKRFTNDNGVTSQGRYTNITHFALIVPFAKRLGIAFGLQPLSKAGYDIDNYEMVEGDSIFYNYKGDGAVQELMLGFAGNVLDSRKHSLSIGINGKYYFGRVNNERRAYRRKSGIEFGGMDTKSLRARDIGFEVGLNYDFRPSNAHSIRFGGVYRPGLNLSFEKTHVRSYFGNYYNIQTFDTLVNTEERGEVFIPTKMSFGLTYTFTPLNEKSSRPKKPSLMYTIAYSLEDWSDYKETFNTGSSTGQYINSNSIRMGFQYIPHRIANDRTTYIHFFDKMSYRIGAYLVNTPYEVGGEQLIDKGLTAGIGIPFVLARSVSTLSISACYGVHGKTSQPGVIKENYYGFNIGINIAPGYDKWFRKRKLN